MPTITKLGPYKDDNGNEIVYHGDLALPVKIGIRGRNNRLEIDDRADVRDLLVSFWGDDSRIEVGPTSTKRAGLRFEFRAGYNSTITVGENVGCAGRVFVSAVEGASVEIGADCMFARSVEVRSDDSHAIYDVPTGARVNQSKSIKIGEHVWLGKNVVVLGGTRIGSGSVIGFRSLVTRNVPNNCVAVGTPAKVVRRDIAWERPELERRRPDEMYPREGEKSELYWNLSPALPTPPSATMRWKKRLYPYLGPVYRPLKRLLRRP